MSEAMRWSMPRVEGPILGAQRNTGSESNQRSQKAEHARGYEAGVAAARAENERQAAELAQRVRSLDAILKHLAQPLAELDSQVERQLLTLALAVGKQLARRELTADPAQIIALIREAVGRLPVTARSIRVQLNPADAAVVREHLAMPANEHAWTLVEDPTQTRGGCLVRTETSQIDARVESRVNAIVSALLGDERSAERAEVSTDAPAGAPPAAP